MTQPHTQRSIADQLYLSHVGTRIAEFRKQQQLSQHQLSERAGISRSQLNIIENGNANTGISNLIRLSESLSVDLSTLLS